MENDTIPTINNIDFYNFIPLLDSYAAAAFEFGDSQYDPKIKFPLREIKSGITVFEKAKICIFKENDHFAVLGISKGGVLEVYKNDRLIYMDDGYLGKARSGIQVSSQKLDTGCEFIRSGNQLEFERDFYILPDQTVTPFKNLILRLGTSTVGRIDFFNKLIKKMLARILISGLRKYPVKLKRTIIFNNDHIEISDEITGNKLDNLEYLQKLSRFFTVFMGSARYFSKYELEYGKGSDENLIDNILGGVITVNEKIVFDEDN